MKRALAIIIVLILAIGMVALFFTPFLGATPVPTQTAPVTGTSTLPQ